MAFLMVYWFQFAIIQSACPATNAPLHCTDRGALAPLPPLPPPHTHPSSRLDLPGKPNSVISQASYATSLSLFPTLLRDTSAHIYSASIADAYARAAYDVNPGVSLLLEDVLEQELESGAADKQPLLCLETRIGFLHTSIMLEELRQQWGQV